MPNGFHVKLESIELFKRTANDTIHDYNNLALTLKRGNIRAENPSFADLLGFAVFDGSTRVHDASREMLTKYATLYDGMQQAAEVVSNQLSHISKALGETHQLYSEIDDKHAAVFQRFLDEHPSNPDGGGDGATGQD